MVFYVMRCAVRCISLLAHYKISIHVYEMSRVLIRVRVGKCCVHELSRLLIHVSAGACTEECVNLGVYACFSSWSHLEAPEKFEVVRGGHYV